MTIDRHTFGILGGDQRQVALAHAIAADGFTVYACGFDTVHFQKNVYQENLAATVAGSDVLLLPLPVTADGSTLKAPYAAQPIRLDSAFAAALAGKRVYGGMIQRALSSCPALAQLGMQDYYAREDFALRNAAVTAEGAIGCALQAYPGALFGSRCLVAGFGRIGSQLAPRLRALGAQVTVSARRPAHLACIEALGCRALDSARLNEGGEYDMIFNTVPAQLFTRSVLAAFPAGTLLIDLSSAPGGVDMDAAGKLGIQAVHAFSLPAKVAPRAAGEIIKQTVYQMMKE